MAGTEAHPEGLAPESTGSGQRQDCLGPRSAARPQHTPEKLPGQGEGQRVGRRTGEETMASQSTQDPTTPSPGFQGPRPPGDAPVELSVGSGSATAGAMPSALAGAGPAVPGRSEVAPEHASEAVGTPPRTGEPCCPPPTPALWIYCFPAILAFPSASPWGLHPRGPPFTPQTQVLPSYPALLRDMRGRVGIM